MWANNKFCLLYQLPQWNITDVRVRKYLKRSPSPIRTAFGKRGEKAFETVNYIWILDVFLTTLFPLDKLLDSSKSGFIIFISRIIIPMAAKSPGCPQLLGGRLVPNSEWQWRHQGALHSRVSSNNGSSLFRKLFSVTPVGPLPQPPGGTLINMSRPVKVCTLTEDQQWDNKECHPAIWSSWRSCPWQSGPDKMWSTGEGNGKPFRHSCLENPVNSVKRQKDMTLKDVSSRLVGFQYAIEEKWEIAAERSSWVRRVMGPRTWSKFSECWVLSQLFNSPLSPSSRNSLVPLRFLPLIWYCLHIWGCYFSWKSWFQLVLHPAQHFSATFPVVMYGCESWAISKAESWKIDAFKLWCWKRLLRASWTARR